MVVSEVSAAVSTSALVVPFVVQSCMLVACVDVGCITTSFLCFSTVGMAATGLISFVWTIIPLTL